MPQREAVRQLPGSWPRFALNVSHHCAQNRNCRPLVESSSGSSLDGHGVPG